MGKGRLIDSNIRKSETFAGFTYRQRDLWHGLIIIADDQGRMPANPAFIRSQVWPYDDIPLEEVEIDLAEIELAKNFMRYEVDGRHYIQILNWWKYQKSEWVSPSEYPPPDGWTDRARYHGKGNAILTLNWEKPGGFVISPPNGNLTSGLPSGLPSQLPSDLACREGEGEGDGRGEGEGDGYVGAAATATAISQLYDITAHTCEQLYQQVTGQISIPSDQLQRALADLETILAHYQGDLDRAAPDGKRVFRRWCGTHGKTTGKAYSRTNAGWLSWWLEEISPAPEGMNLENIPTPSLLCGEGQRLKRQVEEHKSDGSFSRVLNDYQSHLETCKTCGSGSTAPDVIAEVRKLANQWNSG